MKPQHIFTVCFLALVLTSCEKELDIDYHDIAPITVIEGELTPDGVRVGLTLTTPMDEPMDRTCLTDALVTLDDLTEGQSYALSPDPEDFYVNDVAGIPGHDYRLSVERDGCLYEEVTTMFAPTEITGLEFNWIKMPYDHVAVLQVRFHDNPLVNGECYWVKIYRNGELYQWQELDDQRVDDGEVSYTIMTSRRDTDAEDDDEVLYDGDVVTCTVCPVTRDMYNYLETLRNDSNGPAMFTGPLCLGYFLASTPATATITFHPDKIPEYRP